MNAVMQTVEERTGRSMAEKDAAQQAQQYLTFMLGGEVFAIGILAIKEIIEYDSLTVVPMMPDCIRGVINLRGAVVPVIDLQARFGRPTAKVGKKTCIVIFDAMRDGERVELGLMVDAVSEVIEIALGQIEPPPNFGTAVRRDFIRGMGKVASRFVIILEPDKAFDIEEMAALCEAEPIALAA